MVNGHVYKLYDRWCGGGGGGSDGIYTYSQNRHKRNG